MSITVQTVRPSDSGFGEYQLSGDPVKYRDLDTIADYLDLCMQNEVTQTHSDAETEAAEAANGATHGQCGGTILAFESEDGISLECVWVD